MRQPIVQHWDLGLGIATTLDPEAEAILSRLPRDATSRVFDSLRVWLPATAVKAANCGAFAEPEDAGWRQVVLELIVDSSVSGRTVDRLQAEADALLAAVEDVLPEAELDAFSEGFAIDVVRDTLRDQQRRV
jgi:hypothetical protein